MTGKATRTGAPHPADPLHRRSTGPPRNWRLRLEALVPPLVLAGIVIAAMTRRMAAPPEPKPVLRSGPCGLAPATDLLVCEWEEPPTAVDYAALRSADPGLASSKFDFNTPQQCCCRRAADAPPGGPLVRLPSPV